MESYCLNSRIVESDKEFLIQTANDIKEGIIRTSLFVNGELLDASILPHSEELSEDEVLGQVKTAHGEKKSELEYLLKSYKSILKEGRVEGMYHLGTALFHKRMYGEAQQLFRSAIKLRHDYHEAYFFLSRTEMALNHFDEAIEAGRKAVDLRPDYADYRNNLGEAYLDGGSCKKAVIEFEEAIRKNVYYADAYYNLATAYILNAVKREDFGMYTELTTKCMDLFKKAVLIYPEYQNSVFNEATSALSSGDLKRAFSLFVRVREDKKEKQRQEKAAHFHRSLIYTEWLSENTVSERIAFLEKEINKNPDYVDLYHQLAVCCLYRAKFGWQKGIHHFKKALSINPNLKKAQKALDLSEEYFLKLSDAISDLAGKDSF